MLINVKLKVNVFMGNIIKEINKLSLPVVILIAGIILGGFYFASQVNKQKSIERQQQIELEQKKEAREALNNCISNAESNYRDHWRRECKSLGLLSKDCIELLDMTYDEYEKKSPRQNVEGVDLRVLDYYKKRDECSCRLPSYNADSVNETLRENKDECFKKYPQK